MFNSRIDHFTILIEIHKLRQSFKLTLEKERAYEKMFNNLAKLKEQILSQAIPIEFKLSPLEKYVGPSISFDGALSFLFAELAQMNLSGILKYLEILKLILKREEQGGNTNKVQTL
jgi:hypothetical protein